MGSSRWSDTRFGKRVKVGRDRRRWTQETMAKMLSDNGIPMGPTTVAKIEAGDRSVRINEAAGIADLFEVSLDSLLGRSSAARHSALTDQLHVLLDTAEESHQQIRAMAESIREQLSELPVEFDGAEGLRKLGDKTLKNGLEPSEEGLLQLVLASQVFLQMAREKLDGPDEASIELEGPDRGAAQT